MQERADKTKISPPELSLVGSVSRYQAGIILALILIFVGGVRLRSLQLPLERDEGEYAYAGQLLLQGAPPYQDAYSMKFPGTCVAYASIMALFGQSIAGIRLGVLLVNAGAIILVFAITRRLCGAGAGSVAAATYGLLSISQKSLGLAGHATHFVVLPMLGAVLVMLKAAEKPRLWMDLVAGLLLGLAVLMKQSAAPFAVMGAAYILWTRFRIRPLLWKKIGFGMGLFSLGLALPLALTVIALWHAGVLGTFWYWTVTYAGAYGSLIPPQYAPLMLLLGFKDVASQTWPLWLLSGAGCVFLAFDKTRRQQWFFLIFFALFSLLAVCPGFQFRTHYFIVLMPAASMLAGACYACSRDFMATRRLSVLNSVPLLLFLAIWGWVAYGEGVLSRTPVEVLYSRMYAGNPFVESRVIGEYIEKHSEPSETIAVLGSEPQIYFYAHRRSATGYIYMYPLMEPHKDAAAMQHEMASQIEAAKPRYMVIVHLNLSWLKRNTSPVFIFDWYMKEVQGYDVVGIVDLLADGSRYRWDAQAEEGTPVTPDYIVVLRRK